MAGKSLLELTPAELAERRAQAQAGRAVAVEARRRSTLRRDFLDAPEWDRLAAQYRVRLPPWGAAPTTGAIRRLLTAIGRSVPWYLEQFGYRTLTDFAERNPTWPARALAGMILEAHASEQRAAERATEGRTKTGHLLTCLEPHGGPCAVP